MESIMTCFPLDCIDCDLQQNNLIWIWHEVYHHSPDYVIYETQIKKKENEEMNVFGQKIDADAIRAKINLKNFIFTQRSSCV